MGISYRTILKELSRIHSEIREIKFNQKRMLSPNSKVTGDVTNFLLSLPDHLRRTYICLLELKEASAKEVSLKTKKARAVESSYLNQLVRQKLLRKKRVSRKVIFYI